MIHVSAAGEARYDEALCLQQSESLCGSPPPITTPHPILPFPVAWTELIAVGLIGMTAASVINHCVPHKEERGMGRQMGGRERKGPFSYKRGSGREVSRVGPSNIFFVALHIALLQLRAWNWCFQGSPRGRSTP